MAGDVNRLGITGFCWGGRITWLYAAHNPQLKAGVAWYGRIVGQCQRTDPQAADRHRRQAERAGARTLRRNRSGHPDRNRRPDERGARQTAANPASKASTIHVYDQAPHAFHADYRPSYRKDDAEDGWRRLQAWFRQHGV
jgi:carboxymethylenebutenolidase